MSRGQERLLWLLILTFFVIFMVMAMDANEAEWKERCPVSETWAGE